MNWLRKMMYGRYGSDQLGMALIIFSIALTIVSYFLPVPFLGYLSLIPLIFCVYRMFSKNIGKRQKENLRFLQFWHGVKTRFKGFFARVRDKRYYRYFSCPNCRQKVRVPKGKGKINITCPKCNEKFIRKS